jgi:Ni/Co efflux regulator RcnB
MMNKSLTKKHHSFSLLLSALLFSTAILSTQAAFADKPLSHPQGKSKGDRSDKHHESRSHGDQRDGDSINISLHFGDRQRGIVHDYYDKDYRSGFCPPGLAKKRNGCMPPGQAKKWSRGQPLPRDVIFYDLPPRLVVELGVPPAGHKYVRVAADILLIAVGTSIVVDAIEDLGNI